MRVNQPVTQVETLLPKDQFIYSRTDLKGIIVEANQAFADISAYTREEMIGQPHNLVRHPDMPPQAFEDMWRDLKAGRPWRGLVKNRRKDGGFYWVVANASPVRENGKIVGYQSVRTCPERHEVEAATVAYEKLLKGDRSIRVFHGRVVPARRSPWAVFCCSEVQPWLIGGSSLLLSGLVLLQQLFPSIGLQTLLLPLSVLALLIALFFLVVFVPTFNKEIALLTAYLEQLLLSGELTQRFNLKRQDPVGVIARKIDRFVSSIQATIQCMADSARQVRSIAADVSQGVTHVQFSAQQQNQATNSAAAGIEEITMSIAEVATRATHTCHSAAGATTLSEQGAVLSQQACSTILSLADTVKQSAVQVEQLGKQSEEISRITGVIKEIAEQTNLLALNAAIEAARAGEMGRGFAVVADEVRKLAERTTNATEEISSMIQAVQAETGKAVDGMRGGAEQVERGVSLVQQAQDYLHNINQQMQQTTQMVSDISLSAQEQNQAMGLMAENVESIAVMTEQNMKVVELTTDTVQHLNKMVHRMEKAVKQYSV